MTVVICTPRYSVPSDPARPIFTQSGDRGKEGGQKSTGNLRISRLFQDIQCPLMIFKASSQSKYLQGNHFKAWNVQIFQGPPPTKTLIWCKLKQDYRRIGSLQDSTQQTAPVRKLALGTLVWSSQIFCTSSVVS